MDFINNNKNYGMSRASVVDIATGHGLEDREVRVRIPVGSRIFSSPRRPDHVSNGNLGLFAQV
jgi:hypothetical protein